MLSIRTAATLSVGVLLTLGACSGGDGDDAATTGAPDPASDVQTLRVASLDSLKFEPPTLTATAGDVRFVHENRGALVHSFVIDGAVRISDDGEETAALDAGDYTYYCDVPGHRQAGMEGELTVTP